MLNIAYLSDKHLERLQTSITSISFSTKEIITFHIICINKDYADFKIKKEDSIKFYFYKYDTKSITYEHINIYCMVLFAVPKLVDMKENRLLIIDPDIYSLNYNISKVFQENKYDVVAQRDFSLDRQHQFFEYNSGVILINDVNKIKNRFFKYINWDYDTYTEENFKNLHFGDQLPFNVFLKENSNEISSGIFSSHEIGIIITRENINDFYYIDNMLIHTSMKEKEWTLPNKNLHYLFYRIKKSVEKYE